MSAHRPGTSVRFDAKSLAELMRKMKNRSEAQRNIARDPTWAVPVPAEVGLQLTYRCNLRCVHCYQWNDAGLFQPLPAEQQRGELPLPIIERVLAETSEARSKLYVWGGEPLLHSQFDEIARLIARAQRAVNLCTNGLLIDRHLEALRALGPGLVLFVSVDGLEPQHDAIRGRGTFAKTARQLEAVLAEKRAGRFAGEVSLSCMVADPTIGHLVEIASWAERLGANSIYFQYPWFIGPETARAMDAVWAERFAWLGPLANGVGSWHSYTHAITPGLVPALQEELAALAARTFGVRVRFQPELRPEELAEFVAGGARPAEDRTMCLSIANRMEVLADGRVSSCKFFPEFLIGDLGATGASTGCQEMSSPSGGTLAVRPERSAAESKGQSAEHVNTGASTGSARAGWRTHFTNQRGAAVAASCVSARTGETGSARAVRVAELWQGERFRTVRAKMRELGLLPICSKCTLLYQNGA